MATRFARRFWCQPCSPLSTVVPTSRGNCRRAGEERVWGPGEAPRQEVGLQALRVPAARQAPAPVCAWA